MFFLIEKKCILYNMIIFINIYISNLVFGLFIVDIKLYKLI